MGLNGFIYKWPWVGGGTDASKVLGVSRAALSAILNESAHLSPGMALRIEQACDAAIDTLMRTQTSQHIARARTQGGEIKVAPFMRKPLDPQLAPV